MLKITKGNNSAKNVDGVTVLIPARRLVMLYISTKFCEIISTSSIMLYISTKFCEIISNGIKVIERT